jgi:hypothetical protein
MHKYGRLSRHCGSRNLFRIRKQPADRSAVTLTLDRPADTVIKTAVQAIAPFAASWLVLTRVANLLTNWSWLPDSGTSGCRRGGTGPAQKTDPQATTMIAPPNPAVPITRLPEDELVTTEINQHGS